MATMLAQSKKFSLADLDCNADKKCEVSEEAPKAVMVAKEMQIGNPPAFPCLASQQGLARTHSSPSVGSTVAAPILRRGVSSSPKSILSGVRTGPSSSPQTSTKQSIFDLENFGRVSRNSRVIPKLSNGRPVDNAGRQSPAAHLPPTDKTLLPMSSLQSSTSSKALPCEQSLAVSRSTGFTAESSSDRCTDDAGQQSPHANLPPIDKTLLPMSSLKSPTSSNSVPSDQSLASKSLQKTHGTQSLPSLPNRPGSRESQRTVVATMRGQTRQGSINLSAPTEVASTTLEQPNMQSSNEAEMPSPKAACRAPWCATVHVPERYRHRRSTIEDTAMRSISFLQVSELAELAEEVLNSCNLVDENPHSPKNGQPIKWQRASMYIMNALFVLPLSEPFTCSFVELVASTPRYPVWFVSHWWGHHFLETVQSLRWHVKCRRLSSSTLYWICTFAINQHNVGNDLGSGVMESPFVHAIRSKECVGVILVLDGDVTPMRRIWCVFEYYVSTVIITGKKYDICAMIAPGTQSRVVRGVHADVQPGPALMIDCGKGERQLYCEPEDGHFPHGVSEAGAEVDVASAQASNQGDLDAILQVLADTVGLDSANRSIRSHFRGRAIWSAANDDNVGRLRFLLSHGTAELNQPQAPYGATALFQAVQELSTDCTELLLEKHADVNIANNFGATPLYMAVINDSKDLVKRLLAASADTEAAQKSGLAPLHAAAKQDSEECMRLLLASRANLNKETLNDRFTPLHMAAQMSSVAAVHLLVSARANINAKLADGSTPLDIASQDASRKDVRDILRQSGGRPGRRR